MKYFIAYIGNYDGDKMAAGNTFIETDGPIDSKTRVRAIERMIAANQKLDRISLVSFQEIRRPNIA